MTERPYDPFADSSLDDPADEFRPRPPLRAVKPQDHTPAAVVTPSSTWADRWESRDDARCRELIAEARANLYRPKEPKSVEDQRR